MEWELTKIVTSTEEKKMRYTRKNWVIEYDTLKQSGRILKSNNFVEAIGVAWGDLAKGLGIPNYVVEKANEIIK